MWQEKSGPRLHVWGPELQRYLKNTACRRTEQRHATEACNSGGLSGLDQRPNCASELLTSQSGASGNCHLDGASMALLASCLGNRLWLVASLGDGVDHGFFGIDKVLHAV